MWKSSLLIVAYGSWQTLDPQRRQGRVAVDQGNSVGTGDGASLASCQASCERKEQCGSLAYCTLKGGSCWLKDKQFQGGEPTRWNNQNHDCTTYYQSMTPTPPTPPTPTPPPTPPTPPARSKAFPPGWNGLAQTPPMGWRSWNMFGAGITQDIVVDSAKALVAKRRSIVGLEREASLCDVGYCSVGLDEGWEACGAGVDNTQHDAEGRPAITDTFPDMGQMVTDIHGLGLSAGWYLNGCKCGEKVEKEINYKGDILSLHDLDFDGAKFDGCGKQKNMTKYAELMQATGKNYTIENCHWGDCTDSDDSSCPTKDWCPFNWFRTSGDIRPTYGSILANLLSADKFNQQNVTGPGCWAYPDMLEIGVTLPQPPGAYYKCDRTQPHGPVPTIDCQLNVTEQRTHFAAWAITSAPLILGMDLRNDTVLNSVWDIITHLDVIEINQAWDGDSGRMHSKSIETVSVPNCGNARPCSQPAWTIFSKRLPRTSKFASRVALLLMNNADRVANVSANLSQVHGLETCRNGCYVRDVWERKDLGSVHKTMSAELQPHESQLLVLSSPTLVSV